MLCLAARRDREANFKKSRVALVTVICRYGGHLLN